MPAPAAEDVFPGEDLRQVSRRGPQLAAGLEPPLPATDAGGEIPFEPLERDATEGLRHGFVQTTSGRFGFRTTDLSLPSRVSLFVGRVYDSGLMHAIPGVPSEQNPRVQRDLGPNWILRPTSVLIQSGTGFTLLTDEAGLVPYVPANDGSGEYVPAPDRPLRFGRLEPVIANTRYRMRLSDGNVRTYEVIPGEPYLWMTREEDPAGNALTYVYDSTYLRRIESSDGTWIEFHRPLWGEPAPPDLPAPRIVRITDSAGRSLQLGYDSAGRLTDFTAADGGSWNFSYDGADHVADVTAPDGRVLFHLVTDSSDRATLVRIGSVDTAYTYGAGQTDVSVGGGPAWRYAFDASGMTTSVTDPEGGVTTIARDPVTGDVSEIVEPTGARHRFEHDGGHRLLRYVGPVPNDDGTDAEWTFARDALGRITSARTPDGARREFVRDAAGWLAEERVDTDADGTTDVSTVWERDPVTGDVVAQIDGAGRRTEYTWTAAGRLAAIRPACVDDDLDGTPECPEYRLSWDAAGNLSGWQEPAGPGAWNTWTWTWDAAGRPLTQTDPLGGTRSWEYDALGRVIATTDALGARTEWARDVSGRVVSRTDALGQVRS